MRYSTLKIANQVLNATDFDTVSTLGETEESEQVLDIIERAYVELDLGLEWFPRKQITRLETSTGTSYNTSTDNWYTSWPAIPWAMAIPTGVEAVYKVFYGGSEMKFLPPEDAQRRIENGSFFKTTGDPKYWTTGLKEEKYIVFDSYDSDTETYLNDTRSSAYVLKYSTTSLDSDDDIPDMPDRYYSALINRCIELAFRELVGNQQIASDYRQDARSSRNKLYARNSVTKVKSHHPGDFSTARRRRGSRIILSQDVNVV